MAGKYTRVKVKLNVKQSKIARSFFLNYYDVNNLKEDKKIIVGEINNELIKNYLEPTYGIDNLVNLINNIRYSINKKKIEFPVEGKKPNKKINKKKKPKDEFQNIRLLNRYLKLIKENHDILPILYFDDSSLNGYND